MAPRAARPLAAALAAVALAGALPLPAAATPVARPLARVLAVPGTGPAATADVGATVVEEAPLEVAEDGAEQLGALDPATESAADAGTHEDAGDQPTDIVLAESAREVVADAVVVGLTEPIEVPATQVSALGVTWLGAQEGVQVDVRNRVGDDWDGWLTLDQEGGSGGEEGSGPARQGTAPYLVTQDAVVQVRVLVLGDTRPSDLRLTLVGVGEQPIPLLEDSTVVVAEEAPVAQRSVKAAPSVSAVDVATVTGPGPVTAPRPTILLRSSWAARPFRDGEPEVRSVQAAVIHHTVSANNYAQSQVPAMLRSIQAYHQDGRGWSDIGYNFLVDRFGTTWEGRQGGVDLPIRGVHASEANSVSTGISVIGRHDTADVPRVTRDAVTRLVAWKLAIHSVPVGATFVLNGVTLPNVIGHRDVPSAQTACPGKYLVRLLPAIRAGAASLQSFLPVPNNRSVTADGSVDLLRTGNPSTVVTLAADPVERGARIGNGWLPMDMVTIGPALRGGSTRDVLAREAATGRLWVYHSTGAGTFAGRTALGTGWGAMEHVLSPGDFNGDGRGDLIAIEKTTGLMWFYPGNGAMKFGPRTRIGHGWGHVQATSSTGDVTGDRVPDVVGVLDDGTVKVYAGSGRGAFRATTTVGRVTVPVDEIIVPGDLTFDGRPDIILRDASGDGMLTMPSRGTGTFGSPTAWGSGWGDMHTLISGAGWRGTSGRSILGIDGGGYFYEYPARSSVSWSSTTAPGLDTGSAVLTAVVGDAIGSGLADVVTTDTSGYLYIHEARGGGDFAPPVRIGQGWGGFTQLLGIGDLDFDGVPELLAKYQDGRLFVYPFDASRDGSLDHQYQVGNGFGTYALVAAPDWDGNGGSTVFAIHQGTGALRAFFARAGTTLMGGATIGSGWLAFSDVVGVSNPVSTGAPALLARTPSGTTYLYLGDGNGGFGRRVAVTSMSVPQEEALR